MEQKIVVVRASENSTEFKTRFRSILLEPMIAMNRTDDRNSARVH